MVFLMLGMGVVAKSYQTKLKNDAGHYKYSKKLMMNS